MKDLHGTVNGSRRHSHPVTGWVQVTPTNSLRLPGECIKRCAHAGGNGNRGAQFHLSVVLCCQWKIMVFLVTLKKGEIHYPPVDVQSVLMVPRLPRGRDYKSQAQIAAVKYSYNVIFTSNDFASANSAFRVNTAETEESIASICSLYHQHWMDIHIKKVAISPLKVVLDLTFCGLDYSQRRCDGWTSCRQYT